MRLRLSAHSQVGKIDSHCLAQWDLGLGFKVCYCLIFRLLLQVLVHSYIHDIITSVMSAITVPNQGVCNSQTPFADLTHIHDVTHLSLNRIQNASASLSVVALLPLQMLTNFAAVPNVI